MTERKKDKVIISIVCVFNKRDILERYLLDGGLDRQSMKKYELILLDNTSSRFECAVDALNYGIKRTKGKYIIFVHQDVRFEDRDILKNIVEYAEQKPNFGVIGVAGRIKNEVYTNIKQGKGREFAGNRRVSQPMELVTVDEVLFMVRAKEVQKHNFDINNRTWHLYAVEYCLSEFAKGKKNYVFPCKIFHLSPGNIDRTYFLYLDKLIKQYRPLMKSIETTCGRWRTNRLLFSLQKLKRKVF